MILPLQQAPVHIYSRGQQGYWAARREGLEPDAYYATDAVHAAYWPLADAYILAAQCADKSLEFHFVPSREIIILNPNGYSPWMALIRAQQRKIAELEAIVRINKPALDQAVDGLIDQLQAGIKDDLQQRSNT